MWVSKGNPCISCIGGVLRNHHIGQVLGYFAKSTGHLWAYEVKVQAMLNALLFCQQHNFHKVIIESDSSLALGWTMNGDKRPWKLIQEFNYIDYLMSLVSCIGVNHILRKDNTSADYLANQGCGREHLVWVLSDPCTYLNEKVVLIFPLVSIYFCFRIETA